MTIDDTKKEPDAPRPEWELPEIVEVRIKRIPYKAPKLRYFESYLAKYNEAIEFLIKTDGSFPIRSLSPVLYVGNEPVTESEAIEENVCRFLALEFDQLKEGAPISLGWPGLPKVKRKETKFRYNLPGGDEKK